MFNLPAGPLKVALGADYRQTQYAYQPDSLFVTGDSLAYGSDTPSHGEQDVAEVFAETLMPVLSEQPFAKDVSLDLAYRYSKYNAFSGKSTWKADGSWTVFSGLRFRGGYSVAIRAPSLADLFVGQSVSNQNVTGDPCDVLEQLSDRPERGQGAGAVRGPSQRRGLHRRSPIMARWSPSRSSRGAIAGFNRKPPTPIPSAP